MKKKIVVALGGNALGNDPDSQKEALKNAAKSIVNLVEDGNDLIITHGNGPQVGMINLAMEDMPLPECGAMSQGYIGYHIQNAIQNQLRLRDIDIPVATIVTQVLVNRDDPAFTNPTKPVGPFYRKKEAEIIAKDGLIMIEDSGRGYRRVVPSPQPLDIIEKKGIKHLSDLGAIVISCGGGGIPVIESHNQYIGVPAVIDKDLSSSKLAILMDADLLVILTEVEKVAINFGKKTEKWIDSLSIDETEAYIKGNEFAEGSMLPKVTASLAFSKSKAGRKSLITSLDKAMEGLAGKTGTWIG